MDDKKIIPGIAFFFLFFISIKLAAQKVDFSGIWLLKNRIGISEVNYENGMVKLLKVNPKSDSIIVERVNTGGDGKEYSIIEMMSDDGSPESIVRPENQKRVSTIKCSDNRESVVETVICHRPNSESENDYTYTEFWSFPDSTKKLTVEKSQKISNGDSWSMRGIYERNTQAQLSFETATGQGIRFENGLNWEGIKAKAKHENKYIFVDCFATWCGPCRKMDVEIFPLNRVGDFINNKFISLKMQMNSTKNDNEEVRHWYATTRDFIQEYNIIGFPTFLFFSPDGVIVHKGMGFDSAENFINLASDALYPAKQYFSLLREYKSGRKDYTNMDRLALKARELGDKQFADSIAIDYKINILDKLSVEELSATKYLDMITTFYSAYNNTENSNSGLFKLFYDHGKKIDDAVKYNGFSSGYINTVITREEINTKLHVAGTKPDWTKIHNAIKVKYPEIDADLLILDAQIVYYGKRKDWNNQIKCFVAKVDKYGPLSLGDPDGQGSDNVIVEMMVLHCNDNGILNKAIGWIEEIIKSKAYINPPAQVYGNYAALLYKAGRTEEGIEYFEKFLTAKGYDKPEIREKYCESYAPKAELLARMKRSEKIDNTWNISAFF